MKKTLILLTILCPFLAFPKGFILKGNVEGLQSGTISLTYAREDGDDTTLTAPITGGTFAFAGNVPEPELARLAITEGGAYNTSLFLENATINMHLIKDDPDKTVITGSASEIIYEKLQPGLRNFFENARQNEAAHHQPAHAHADSVWSAQQHQWIQNIRATIAPDAKNYAAIYFIRWLLFRPDNYDTILSVFMQLSPTVRNGIAGKKFLADFEQMRRSAPGQPAPEITGKDTLGHPVTLARYKGKVILLDFWSSYCGPCRQENKRLLSIYQKYHVAGFEIISFSLDNERSLWMNAIKTDGLPWPQASELRGGASASADVYEITDLPRNVLIDRTGKIYAKDVHGAELTDALERLLKKGK